MAIWPRWATGPRRSTTRTAGPHDYEGHTAGLQCVAASPDGEVDATGVTIARCGFGRATQKTAEVIETATFVLARFSRIVGCSRSGMTTTISIVGREGPHDAKTKLSGRLTDLAFDPKKLPGRGSRLYLLDLETRQVRARITSGSTQQGRLPFFRSGLNVGAATPGCVRRVQAKCLVARWQGAVRSN
jgi:hypothetical protein